VYHDYRTRLWAFLSIRASYASAEAALLQRHPQERRVLALPPEQATFANLAVGGLWLTIVGFLGMWRGSRRGGGGADAGRGPLWPPVVGINRLKRSGFRVGQFMFLLGLILTLLGTYKRWQKVREQKIPIRPFTIFRATLRGHLAYTYHLCRHLTRYYTLPLALIGLVLPPLLMLVLILIGIVVGVDYVRLGPEMSLGEYAMCSVLDDCAYEVGIVWGCMKHGTWKPLWPIVRKKSRILP